MICHVCGENEASVYIEEYFNGQAKQVHLCPQCAAKYQMTISFGDVFQGFLSNMAAPQKEQQKTCPKCGLTYQEFKKLGKLGCAACYQAFSAELSQVFERVQPGGSHRGKIPKGREAEFSAPRILEDLKSQLKKAVELEEYEEAAKLRDRIHEIEKGAI